MHGGTIKLGEAGRTHAAERAKPAVPLRVVLEAEFGTRHSFGVVARELAFALSGRRELVLQLGLVGERGCEAAADGKGRTLRDLFTGPSVDTPDFHIRHHWPPCLEPPQEGRWILAQPWEYGSLPESWVEAFREQVDDVWCFSSYVRDAYLRAGFDESTTALVPHGIDPDVFRPEASAVELETDRRFKFLYVGGTLGRKGADVLLEAYLRAFSSLDDVVLVVKDFGTDSFYAGQTMGARFMEAAQDPTRPKILYLDRELEPFELAGLYTACDAFVAPYRGEGFSLPTLEAMACGLHVIVTCGGATDDFVDGTCGSRVAADRVEIGADLSDGSTCVAPMFVLQVDVDELARTLRWAYEHPEEGRCLGRAASKRARSDWTWERSAEIAVARLRELSERPIRRHQPRDRRGSGARKEEDHDEGSAAGQSGSLPLARRLELSLMKGDLKAAAGPLGVLASQGTVAPEFEAALSLAEKVLASEKDFVHPGLGESDRVELLASVRALLLKLPGRGAAAGIETARQTVSLTMIVRDEEENIAACLECARDCVDEVIVVDTGSMDRTKEIASSLGAKVYEFPWVDSFARARNEALRHASGDWILWLDADDRLEAPDRDRLRRVIASLRPQRMVGYAMKVECTARPGGSPTVVDHVRLFPNHSGLRWEYRVHENILPAINRLGGEIVWTDVVIRHVGYLDEELRVKKRERDHALLLKSIEESPKDPFVHFNLGHSLIESGELDEAAHHLEKSLELSEPHYSQVKKAYALLAQVERRREGPEAALKVANRGLTCAPEYPELIYLSALYCHEVGELEEAERRLRRILETESWPAEFGSFDVGILSYKAKHQLARVLLDGRRGAEAERLLAEVLGTHPEFVPAITDLALARIDGGREEEIDPLLERLRACGHDAEAEYLAGRREEKAGREHEAALAYARAHEADPECEDALRDLVGVSLRIRSLEPALARLQVQAERAPRSAQAQYNLGGFLHAFGQHGKALVAVEKSLALRPSYPAALEIRAAILEALRGAESNGGGPQIGRQKGTSGKKEKRRKQPRVERTRRKRKK